MNVNTKGSIGLIEVIRDLYNMGFHCYTPFDDYSPVDLITLSSNGEVIRLQVKYRSGRNEVNLRSVVNGKNIPINLNLIDGWAVFIEETNKIFYIPKDNIGINKSFIPREELNKDIKLWKVN